MPRLSTPLKGPTPLPRKLHVTLRPSRSVTDLRELSQPVDPTGYAAKEMNRRAMGTKGVEYGDDSMGLDTGMLGQSGGALRAAPRKEKKSGGGQPASKRRAVQMSSGKTGGISSSLVFTPVQGIELSNPNAQAEKVRDANNKWFSNQSGFQSAAPR